MGNDAATDERAVEEQPTVVGWDGDVLTLEAVMPEGLWQQLRGPLIIAVPVLAVSAIWPPGMLLAASLGWLAGLYRRSKLPPLPKVALRFDRGRRVFSGTDGDVALPEGGALLLERYSRKRRWWSEPSLHQRLYWTPDVAWAEARELPPMRRLGRNYTKVRGKAELPTPEGSILVMENWWGRLSTLAVEMAFALEIPLIDLSGDGPPRLQPVPDANHLMKLMSGVSEPPPKSVPKSVVRKDEPGRILLRCRVVKPWFWPILATVFAVMAVLMVPSGEPFLAALVPPLFLMVPTALLTRVIAADRRVEITSEAVTVVASQLGVQVVPQTRVRYEDITRIACSGSSSFFGGNDPVRLELNTIHGVRRIRFANREQAEYVRACILHPPARKVDGYR